MAKKKLSIHLTSDTHIEMGGGYPAYPPADVGVFAGDIGILSNGKELKKFFKKLRPQYNHVIWVLGNHEFYHSEYGAALEQAEKIAEEFDMHLMDIELGTDNLEIDGTTFWGSTLWTDFNNNDWFAARVIKHGLNDFRLIQVNNRLITTLEVFDINKRTREKINWDADVVITHHAPIVIPHPAFPFSDIGWGFYNSRLESKIANSQIKYWLYGHTHHSADVNLKGTRVMSNCYGYHSPSGKSEAHAGYNLDLIIEI